MNLETISQLATIIGVSLILPQLYIAIYSLVQNNKREKLKSTIDYFEQVDGEIKNLRIELSRKYGSKIKIEDIDNVYKLDGEDSKINTVLNAYERLALATNMNVLDYETVKRMTGKLVRTNFTRYEEYIRYRRSNHNAKTAWVEFEKLSKRLESDNHKNH